MRRERLWLRKDGFVIEFEGNTGVIINDKVEMKGSAITGSVAKEWAEMWPKIASIGIGS
jgi:large subunit ribosomal protein L23e